MLSTSSGTRTVGIIELDSVAQTWTNSYDSHQLAGRRFGDSSLLQWVLRRLSDAHHLDHLVVVADREVSTQLPVNVDVYCNPGDPLARLTAAAEAFDADLIVRVRLVHPLIDPELIERLIQTAKSHEQVDYTTYRLDDGRPAVLSPLGVVAELCRARALKAANQKATLPADRQDPTRFIYSHPELFQMRLIPLPASLNRPDFRLAISSQDDWEHMDVIMDALGQDDLDWRRISQLLEQQPAIRDRMAALNVINQSTELRD